MGECELTEEVPVGVAVRLVEYIDAARFDAGHDTTLALRGHTPNRDTIWLCARYYSLGNKTARSTAWIQTRDRHTLEPADHDGLLLLPQTAAEEAGTPTQGGVG